MLLRGPMTRTALLLSSLFVAACTVGEIPDKNPATPGTDAGSGSGTTDGGANANGCVDRLPPPAADAHSHLAGGGTNAGMDCTLGGCHKKGALGAGAPEFRFAGTVYKADGTTPTVGAVVLFTSGAKKTPFYTDSAGNFNIRADDPSLATPFSNGNVSVTGCPTIHPMGGLVTEGTPLVGCGSSGCHGPGGTGGKLTLPDQ
jgi:hypothetical protein